MKLAQIFYRNLWLTSGVGSCAAVFFLLATPKPPPEVVWKGVGVHMTANTTQTKYGH